MKTTDFSIFIERYIAGEMDITEKIWFEKELEGNEELRKEVDLRRKTDSVLKNHDILILRNKLSEIENRRKATSPVSGRKRSVLRYAAVFAGLVIIGCLVIFSGSNLSSKEILNRYYKVYEPTTASRSSVGDLNSNYDKAINYYNENDFKNAAISFIKVQESDPKYMESIFLYGVSNLETSNYGEAEKSFLKVIDNANNLFIEDAQWYVAFCYIKTNDKIKAQNQLAIIRKSDGIYKNYAKKILKKLK